MFKWIMTNFFLKRQGLLLPAHNKHIANKQAQTNCYCKQVRRIHLELLDWYNADTLHDSVLRQKLRVQL
jgi:hypothetical protein